MKIEVMDAAAHTDNIASNTILKKLNEMTDQYWRMVFFELNIKNNIKK
jgi:hypothetical protein